MHSNHDQDHHPPPQDSSDGQFVFLPPRAAGRASKRRPHRTVEAEEEKKMEDGSVTTRDKKRSNAPTSIATATAVMTESILPLLVRSSSSACDSSATVTMRFPRIKKSNPQQSYPFHRQQRRCWILGESSSSWGAVLMIVLILFLGLWFVANFLVFAVMHRIPPSHTQPQPPLSNQQDLWSNPKYNVVHVVQTRFMQMQPHLLHLGQARLQLFATLTVPSMIHQTEQSFLWIVRTDPDLDSSIREPLIQLLQQVPNVILVASNDNPEGFREAHCVADIHADTVWAGRFTLLQSYHDAAATHTVLESRLDADDAVAVDFVELVQTNAAAVVTTVPTTTTPVWRVWCAENHVEWQYDSPWASSSSTTSSTTARGALLGLHAGKCITPGLTWQYGVGVHRSQIPLSSKHHQIQKQVRQCQEDDDKYDDNQCLSKLGGDLPLALRARTPTSAGMDHILMANHTEQGFPMQQLQRSKWKETQESLWESLPLLFGVQARDLWNVRAFIHDHLVDIARDALQGQCTKGHSCKQQSQAVLQELVMAREGAPR